jgi:hypothetical protein
MEKTRGEGSKGYASQAKGCKPLTAKGFSGVAARPHETS